MAAPISNVAKKQFFDKLVEQLAAVYDASERKKQQCAEISRHCKILLTPWPSTNQDQHHVSANTESTGSGTSDAQESKSQECLTPAQTAEIALLDKALAKAQKTRDAHSKVNKIAETGHQQQRLESLPNRKLTPIEVSKPQDDHSQVSNQNNNRNKLGQQGKHKHLTVTKHPQKTEKQQAETYNGGGAGTISQSTLNRLLQKDQGSKTTKSRYVAAHANAPFKTEVTSRRVTKKAPGSKSAEQLRSGRSQLKKASSAPNQNRTGSNHVKAADVKVLIDQEQSHSHSTQKLNTCDNKKNIVPPTQDEVSVSCDVVNMSEPSSQNGRHFRENVTCAKMEAISLDDSNKRKLQEPQEEPGAKAGLKPFNLMTDGANISIPKKLRKVCASNYRLRQKLQALVTKEAARTAPSVAQQFVDRLEASHIDKNDDECDPHQQMLQQAECYDKLLKLLQHVPWHQVSDKCSWQEILKMRKTVEYVLSTFHDMEESYRTRTPVLQQSVTKGFIGQHPFFSQRPAKHLWLPMYMAVGVRCTPDWACPGNLSYSHKQELVEYTSLVHEIQVLQLQLHLLNTVGSALLPQLSDTLHNSEYAVELYRNVYSLLCTSGMTFPTVIKDNIDDLKDTSHEVDTHDF